MSLPNATLLAALLGLGLSLPALAQGPVDAPRAHDPELGWAIAQQGNRALLTIRLELRASLHRRAPQSLEGLQVMPEPAGTDVAASTATQAGGV